VPTPNAESGITNGGCRRAILFACAEPFDNLRTGSVEAAMANQYLIEQPYGVDAAVVTGVPPVA